MSPQNHPYLKAFLIILFAVALTGCSTIRGSLKPWVCDCDQADACNSANSEDEEEWVEDEQDSDDPVVRSVRRDAKDDENAADTASLEPADARLASGILDTSSADRRRAVASSRGVNLPGDDGLIVLAGTFVRGEESTVVLVPGKNIRFYADGSIAGQLALDHHTQGIDLGELTNETVQPVQLVKNGTSQILVHYAHRHESGAIDYRVAIYKAIGTDVGTIFEQTLARRSSPDAPLEHMGRFRILEGKAHRFIEWTYLDPAGNPLGEPQILRWNRWEGVYRLPTPPPTAPRRAS
ncbi:MAG: hypothetical protein ACNA8W_06760 [Bradymonadaceae bacterium]